MISTLIGMGGSLLAPKILSQLRDQKINILHAMPGRLRIQCDNWKSEEVASHLQHKINHLPIVATCKASSITGSILIEFILPYMSEQELDELMKFIVQEASEAILEIDAKITRTMQKSLTIIDKGIKRQSSGLADLDSLLVLFLLGKGIHSFHTAPAFSGSLLYWAYTIIRGKEQNGPYDK
ncbi:hypothetical protein GJU40_16820 [Bacillus lacus]|uniref:Uncharacterized protein n=1 Tax=Metabacillus lacus TaxID=1983721 RepID=A0A7X2M0X4_9BACI|nr:hypothetical protein [Metabacillus lacus]MRX73807.1 hypothetical protein [Metabacillus lacus]